MPEVGRKVPGLTLPQPDGSADGETIKEMLEIRCRLTAGSSRKGRSL